jgi:hypothetical protein
MRYSDAAGISPGDSDDWFNPVLEQDTPLYIDPYLIFDDADPIWTGAYDDVVRFFETAASLVLDAGGQENTPAWRKAVRFLRFPEPHELALGVALGSPRGAGTGEKFAKEIAKVLALVGTSRVEKLSSIAGFALFCDGIGVDRISDIVANILKSRLIAYTQAVNERHGVATEAVRVEHADWDSSRATWKSEEVELYPNPATGGGVLLVPKRFLKDIPRIEPEEFWDWAELTQSSVLRDDLNYDLSESLTQSEKLKAARKLALVRPEIAISYIDRVSDEKHSPYDARRDPHGLIHWYEDALGALESVAPDSPSKTAPTDPDDFFDWVVSLAEDFRFAIEETDAWRILWDDTLSRHRPERIAQAMASVMWRTQCKTANVDLNKETNVGRGPVDFKFSQGWQRRVLVEMKYIGSSHFSSGAEKQLPQYQRSEEIDFGIYLAIGFADADFERNRVRLVEETCEAISTQLDKTIRLVVVDARPKKSASKL